MVPYEDSCLVTRPSTRATLTSDRPNDVLGSSFAVVR